MEHKKPQKKTFTWNALRISFWLMIGIWVFYSVLEEYIISEIFLDLFGYVFWVLIIFTFVVSIIHLNKYQQKGLAITALVISSFLFFVLLFYTYPTNQTIFEEQETLTKNYFMSYEFVLYESSYINIDFSSNDTANIYLLHDNEYLRYEQGLQSYYIIGKQYVRSHNASYEFLNVGTYHFIVESEEEDIEYNFKLETTYGI